MGLPTHSRSIAELARDWGSRPDASIYWDDNDRGVEPRTVPRVFVPRFRLVWADHFLGDALDARWNNTTQGTPTAAAIQNQKNGVFRLALAATDEAETNELNFADNLQFDPTAGLVMEVGFRFVNAIAANHRAVIGFGSARNNTFDSVTYNAWFRVDADMDLLTESDDNTTDTDDDDTDQNLTANIWHYGRIECISANDVRFFAGAGVPTRVNSGVTFKIGPNLVQPIIGVQKASSTGQPHLEIDYCAVYART